MYLRWVGGKSKLVDEILAVMPKHKTYVEPFIGAGWVFWNKTPAKREVINDIDSNLIRFYKGLTVIEDLKIVIDKHGWPYGLTEKECRELFDKAVFILEHPNDFSDEDFIWAFLYVNKFSFSGRMARPTLNLRRLRDCVRPYCGIANLIKDFNKVKTRLKRTIIMNNDWKATLVYDSGDTLFYLDPPYFGIDYTDSTPDYRTRHLAPNPREIFKTLSEISGRFILSYNYHPTILKYTRKYGFYWKKVRVKYEVKSGEVDELIITNFNPKRQKTLLDWVVK